MNTRVFPVHYHVTYSGISLSLPSMIVEDEIKSLLEYEKMVTLVVDRIGFYRAYSRMTDIEGFTIFFDGSKVRWYKCERDCYSHKKQII